MGFSLKSITTKNTERGKCIVIHGEGGVGKTTLAADIAKDRGGLFVMGEDGLNVEGVSRTGVIESWGEFQEALEEIALSDHEFKTIVIDTIDAMIPLLYSYVVETYYEGDEGKAGAFKAYYQQQYQEFDSVLRAFKLMQSKGIDVVVLCHTSTTNHKAPDSEPFNRYEMNLPGGTKTSLAEALYNYADFVLFARFNDIVTEGRGKGGDRVLMTRRNPAWDAKSRKDVPEKLTLSYEAYKKFIIEGGN